MEPNAPFSSNDEASDQTAKILLLTGNPAQRADPLRYAAGADVGGQATASESASHLVPGHMHCARCKFVLTRVNLNLSSGTVSAGDSKTEACPNGCGPLWPVTWEAAAREAWATCDSLFERAKNAEEALASIRRPQLGPTAAEDDVSFTFVEATTHHLALLQCPLCASPAQMWQRTRGSYTTKAVCCSNGDSLAALSHVDLLSDMSCPFFMPPEGFYRSTYREAADTWHAAGKEFADMRERNIALLVGDL